MTASRPAAAVATGLEAATVSSSRVPTGKPRSAGTDRSVHCQWPVDRSHCGQTRQCRRGLPLRSDSRPPGLPTHWQAALRDSRAERREPAPCTEPEPPALSGGKCSLSASGSWRWQLDSEPGSARAASGRCSPAGHHNTAGQDRQEDLIRPTCFNPDIHCKFRPLQLSDRSSKNATKRLRPSSRSRRRSGRSSSGGRARPRACRTPVPPPPRRRSSRGAPASRRP